VNIHGDRTVALGLTAGDVWLDVQTRW
jgi:hypothetical protein